MEQPDFKPKTVLCVAAHPDDLEFTAAGSVAAWTAAGATVHYLICTDASKGTDDRHISTAELINLRREEQRAAAKILGVATVTFLDYEDGFTEVTADLKRDIVREIRRRRPDTVVTPDPTLVYTVEGGMINHSDHRNVGLATMDAVYPLARDHLSFPKLLAEGFEPHKVKDLLFIMRYNNLNQFVDISTTLTVKLRALAAHKSQIDIDQVTGFVKHLATRAGKQAGCELAEGFVRLSLRL